MEIEEKKNIGIVFGGQSSEHDISRFSAQSIIKNLDKNKYEIIMLGITKEGKWMIYDGPVDKLGTGEWQAIAEEVKQNEKSLMGFQGTSLIKEFGEVPDIKSIGRKIDVAFPVLHGINGEDGTIQGFFELAQIPYVGCGVLGSALGMDKYYAKIIFKNEGLPQGKFLVLSRKQVLNNINTVIERIEKQFSYPCFIKPCNSGSSIGVSKAFTKGELINALNLAIEYDMRILVEEFIDGQEVECSVLGNDDPMASTVGEIISCKEFYDYQAKYSSESTSQTLIPANLPSKTILEIREYAITVFKALDLAGLARVDFFVQKNAGKIYINEVNTMPGFTNISMYPKLWEASGLSYSELLDRLIELAEEKYREKIETGRWL